MIAHGMVGAEPSSVVDGDHVTLRIKLKRLRAPVAHREPGMLKLAQFPYARVVSNDEEQDQFAPELPFWAVCRLRGIYYRDAVPLRYEEFVD